MTEKYQYAMDPRTVTFFGIVSEASKGVYALGRTDNKLYEFIDNYKTLEESQEASEYWSDEESGEVLVPGPAIDYFESENKDQTIFDYHQVGRWRVADNHRGAMEVRELIRINTKGEIYNG